MKVITRIAQEVGLGLNDASHAGADSSDARWQDLCGANVAVFDISEGDPQVYYEVGMALALGTQLLILAKKGTEPKFDVAQDVVSYLDNKDLQRVLERELDCAIYGLQSKGQQESCLKATLAYAEGLAAGSNDGLLRVSLNQLRGVCEDAMKFRDAIKNLNTYLGSKAQVILYPRWPVTYPDKSQPRCFIVMAFRPELDATHRAIRSACGNKVKPVRGDEAKGQEIIQSIWEEIGRATHVVVDLSGFNLNVCLELGLADVLGRNVFLIGQTGTEQRLFPAIAKRRCNIYKGDPQQDTTLMKALGSFLGTA